MLHEQNIQHIQNSTPNFQSQTPSNGLPQPSCFLRTFLRTWSFLTPFPSHHVQPTNIPTGKASSTIKKIQNPVPSSCFWCRQAASPTCICATMSHTGLLLPHVPPTVCSQHWPEGSSAPHTDGGTPLVKALQRLLLSLRVNPKSLQPASKMQVI